MIYKPHDIAGKLAAYFIRSPLTPILGIFLLFLGYLSLMIMPREENPQMVVSGSTVVIALPGASAQEIQRVIINPLERKLKEIKGIDTIMSVAHDNFALTNASFVIGEKQESSNLKIYDKIMQNMDIFPQGAQNPIIKPLDIDIDIPIVTVAFYAQDSTMSPPKLFDEVKNIQHRINALDNVAITNIKGGHKHQFNILVDQNRLSAYNLSLGMVVDAVKSLAYNVPEVKNRTKENKIVLLGIKNAIDNEQDIGNIIVAIYQGIAIHLKDVAKIEDGKDFQHYQRAKISVNAATHDQNSSFTPLQDQVTLTVSKLQGTNAVNIANSVAKELEEMKDQLATKGIKYVITRNDGERANEAVNELVYHLILSIIIIAILLVFVLGWRESIIVTFTVPAILAITLFVAYLGDQTINRITLFAFLLSLGLLVDAAIIVIENIHRHLHSLTAKDKTMEDLMVEATDEIGAPTNVATLAIILTMVPMLFVGDMMGQFMQPIPLNVPVALISSLFVAYIFTPYLAAKMLKKVEHEPKKEEH